MQKSAKIKTVVDNLGMSLLFRDSSKTEIN